MVMEHFFANGRDRLQIPSFSSWVRVCWGKAVFITPFFCSVPLNSVCLVCNVSEIWLRDVPCHWQVSQLKSCKGDYVGTFGHYGLIWDMDSTHYIVADPAKGVDRKYRFACLDNANKGYRQNYYVVCPA